MKTYFLIFTLACFIQSSFLPINLCLSLLVARSYVVDDNLNYILAFYIGILLGILNPINLGAWALGFLILVKLPFSQNILTILPVCFLLILGVTFVESWILQSSINYWKIFVEFILIIPFYAIFHFWEDLFVMSPGIKLKIRS